MVEGAEPQGLRFFQSLFCPFKLTLRGTEKCQTGHGICKIYDTLFGLFPLFAGAMLLIKKSAVSSYLLDPVDDP